MCKLFNIVIPPQSTISWNVLSAAEVDAIFRKAGVTCFKARDSHFWFPDADTCLTWLQEVHAAAPAYEPITATKRGWDCDKFARYVSSQVAYKYRCNGFFEVWGFVHPFGPEDAHAWNVFLTPYGAFEAEPQRADIWEIGTNPKYKIQSVYRAD